MRLAVDISEGAPLSQFTIDGWKNMGVKLVIVQYSQLLPQYLAALDGQGLDVDVYTYQYFPRSPWNQTPRDRTEATIRMCQGHKVGTIWPDAEDPNDALGPVNWDANIKAMWACLNLIRQSGYEAGIYSSIYRFQERFGDYAGFGQAGIKCWNADYLRNNIPQADLSVLPSALVFRHGAWPGWSKPDIWQWQNTTLFCGHSVDMNALEDAPMAPGMDPLGEAEIQLSVNAATFDLIAALSSGRLAARHADDSKETVIVIEEPSGNDLSPAIRVKGADPAS